MKGLYKGKYLIVYYDRDEFPIIIEGSAKKFAEAYCKMKGNKIRTDSIVSLITRIYKGIRTSPHIHLVEADTITDDCFKEADEDFVKFMNEEMKTAARRCSELNISQRTFYRKKRAVLVNKNN